MSKNAHSDEIDLLDLGLIIWRRKWTVVLIVLITVILIITFQLNKKPGKTIAITEIKPISLYDEAKYQIYNAFIKEITFETKIINKNKTELGQLEENYKNNLNQVTENYILNDNINYILNDNIMNNYQLKFQRLDINNINKEFLFELFLEKVQTRSNLVNFLKKFNYLKNEDFLNNREYDEAILKLASSITFNKIQTEDRKLTNKDLSPLIIQFETHDSQKWEKFLEFIEKEINLDIQKKLEQMFSNYVNLIKKIIKFKIEDIDEEINLTISEKNKKLLEVKKDNLLQNKYVERIEMIFSESPMSNSEEFYAGNIIAESSNYKIYQQTSLKKIVLVSVILGLILGILYVLLGNAIQKRR